MSAGPAGVEERQVWRHPQTQRVMQVAYVTRDKRQRLAKIEDGVKHWMSGGVAL